MIEIPQLSPEATEEPQRTAVSFSSLPDLYFRPTRFFETTHLDVARFYLLATWCVGISATIDRIDTNLIRAELGTPRPGLELFTESWVAYWLFALIVGILAGIGAWLIGGWWYRVRLKWSGAKDPDKREARLVFIFSSLVHAVPIVLATVVATLLFRDYLEYWNAEELWTSLLVVFPFWGVVTSYKGVRNRFDVKVWRARIWFLILPILFYVAALGVIIVLLSLVGYFEPTYAT